MRALRGVTASAVSNTADLTLPFNLCERTQEVEAALLAAVAATDCALVPGSQLAAVTTLDLSAQSIGALRADDFDGLTGLTTLDLRDNALTTLPKDVFSPLSALTTLDLRDNTGLSYSPHLLSPLTSLTTLDGTTYNLSRRRRRSYRPDRHVRWRGHRAQLDRSRDRRPHQLPDPAQGGQRRRGGVCRGHLRPGHGSPVHHLPRYGRHRGETYAYRVRALNAGGASVESDSVTVLAELVLSGPSDVSHPEESALRVATFTAGPARPSLVWSLTGDDNGDFTIDGGVLRLAASPPMADYESPADDDQDNEYSVTVQVAEAGATSVTMNVTVTVTDVDDSGTLTLSSTRPKLGAALSVTLDDTDGVVDGTPVYIWNAP